ncbi:MAG: methionyl-tRNA formyltransferase [SAR324 cluster bacterium]
MTRAVFLGSPLWAVPCLGALAGPAARALGVEIAGVVTQPDRPAGRGRLLRPCAVKDAALDLGVPVLSPQSLRREEAIRELAHLAPDVTIVCAYGQILTRPVLDMPRLGCWNLHFSLLPRWRGASPVQAAILAGDSETGVSLQRMVEALDAGPLLASSPPIAIGADETAEELGTRLAKIAAAVLAGALPAIVAGNPSVSPQDDARATVCRKIDKRAGIVDWDRASAAEIVRRVRAFTPWPGCASYLGAARLGLVRVEPAEPPPHAAPGTVAADGRVAAASGAVRLIDVKPEGRAVMDFAAFIRGHPEAVGARLTAEAAGGATQRR